MPSTLEPYRGGPEVTEQGTDGVLDQPPQPAGRMPEQQEDVRMSRARRSIRQIVAHGSAARTLLEAEHRALQVDFQVLEQAHLRLQHADREQRHLVGMMVREMKVSLSVVLASLDRLAHSLGEEASETQRESIGLAFRSGQEMLQMMADLLQKQHREGEASRFSVPEEP